VLAAGLGLGLSAAVAAGCGSGGQAHSHSPVSAGPTMHGNSSGSTPPTASGSPAALPDWPTYHRTNDRAGHAPGVPQVGNLSHAWAAKLDGAVYGEPLLVGGRVIAATENDSVYSLRPADGHVVWKRHLGTPVPKDKLPCGNIDPLGITGTPAYDAETGLVFAVAEVTGVHHVLFALDAKTGTVRWHRRADAPGHHPRAEQQRGALTVAHGKVYVPYGGLFGDCGPYRGNVVAVATSGNGPLRHFTIPTKREAGIWAPSGPAVGPGGDLFVAAGNGASESKYDGSDSVTRLSPDLKRLAVFAPKTWRDDNANDLDLGSMGPIPLPGHRIFVAGKRGTGYLLDAHRLGGVGGQLATIKGCKAFGGAARVGRTLYLPCFDGGVRALEVGPAEHGHKRENSPARASGGAQAATNGAGTLHWKWQAASNVTGSPVVGGGAVWTLDPHGGTLYALDPATGKSAAHEDVGAANEFATPTLAGNLVLVGTLHGVVAVRHG
jgi:outer membrane protein assembly factor BamB